MILPHPESDLSMNIMVLGVDIIKQLKKQDFLLLEDVLSDFIKKDTRRTPDLFFDTLTFLYSCGLIEKKDYKIKLIPIKINNKNREMKLLPMSITKIKNKQEMLLLC